MANVVIVTCADFLEIIFEGVSNYAPEGRHRINSGQQQGGDGLFSFSNCQLWATPLST